jgi:hypothetical protein
MSVKFHMAEYESRNFSFDALGKSENEAIGILIQVLRSHADQCGLQPDWWYADFPPEAPARGSIHSSIEWAAAQENFRLREIELGGGYRDREEI